MVSPFDEARDGTAPGEGAAFLVLEDAAGAAARGATVLGRVLGSASGFDPDVRRTSAAVTGSPGAGRGTGVVGTRGASPLTRPT